MLSFVRNENLKANRPFADFTEFMIALVKLSFMI